MTRTPPTPADMLQHKFNELENLVRNCLIDNSNFQPVELGNGRKADGFYFTHYPNTRAYVEGPLRTQAQGILDRLEELRAFAVDMAITPEEQVELEASASGPRP